MALPTAQAPSASTPDGGKTHRELNGRARIQDTLEVRHSRYPPCVQKTDTWPDTSLESAESPLECVGQHHTARRRALVKDAKTMAAMAAGLVTERDRDDKSNLTAAQGKAKPSKMRKPSNCRRRLLISK